IGQWLKHEGDAVEKDETVVELETDKASMELSAPAAGILRNVRKQAGEKVAVGETIAQIDEQEIKSDNSKPNTPAKPQVAAEPAKAKAKEPAVAVTPSARRALRQHGLKPDDV